MCCVINLILKTFVLFLRTYSYEHQQGTNFVILYCLLQRSPIHIALSISKGVYLEILKSEFALPLILAQRQYAIHAHTEIDNNIL